MRRWNGWGDEANHYPMPEGGGLFLSSRLGPGYVLSDAALDAVMEQVPESRLTPHRLIERNPEVRIAIHEVKACPIGWPCVLDASKSIVTASHFRKVRKISGSFLPWARHMIGP